MTKYQAEAAKISVFSTAKEEAQKAFEENGTLLDWISRVKGITISFLKIFPNHKSQSPAGSHVSSAVEKNGTFQLSQLRSQQNFVYTGVARGFEAIFPYAKHAQISRQQ
jgi:hypothetical protein